MPRVFQSCVKPIASLANAIQASKQAFVLGVGGLILGVGGVGSGPLLQSKAKLLDLNPNPSLAFEFRSSSLGLKGLVYWSQD